MRNERLYVNSQKSEICRTEAVNHIFVVSSPFFFVVSRSLSKCKLLSSINRWRNYIYVLFFFSFTHSLYLLLCLFKCSKCFIFSFFSHKSCRYLIHFNSVRACVCLSVFMCSYVYSLHDLSISFLWFTNLSVQVPSSLHYYISVRSYADGLVYGWINGCEHEYE